MSYPTTSVFIVSTKDWEAGRVHPAVAWLEKYTKAFDSCESWSKPYSDWLTEDSTWIRPNGEAFTGGNTAFEAAKERYRLFKAFRHEPRWASVWETDKGWQMVGEGVLYMEFPKEESEEKKIKDVEGRKWDLAVNGMFRFEFVKDESAKHNGIKIRLLQEFLDTGPVLVQMVKKGMITQEEFLK